MIVLLYKFRLIELVGNIDLTEHIDNYRKEILLLGFSVTNLAIHRLFR